LIQKIYKVDPLTCPKCQGKIVLLFLAEFPYLVLPPVPQRIQYSPSTLLGRSKFASIPFLICTFREVEVAASIIENPEPGKTIGLFG
jgi:hypothetical protein